MQHEIDASTDLADDMSRVPVDRHRDVIGGYGKELPLLQTESIICA
jgi:hypothetical protein